jgi:hypothetical protein
MYMQQNGRLMIIIERTIHSFYSLVMRFAAHTPAVCLRISEFSFLKQRAFMFILAWHHYLFSRQRYCKGEMEIVSICMCVCVYVCILPLIIRHVMRIFFFCAALCCYLWPAWLYHIFHMSHKCFDFQKNNY